jgi:hypothetical protein
VSTNLRQWLRQAPEGVQIVCTPEALAAALDASDEPEYVSTGQASKRLGGSRKFWERAAREIEGVLQPAGNGGRYLLPLAGCRAHLLRHNNRQKKRGLSGPRSKGRRGPQAVAS